MIQANIPSTLFIMNVVSLAYDHIIIQYSQEDYFIYHFDENSH